MNIGGFMTTTLLDYPGHVACTIFTRGCNLRCPFCQNADLVLNTDNTASAYNTADILAFLKKRAGRLEGVCISGGEPTLQADLMEFIYSIKSLNYLVKLDTNGLKPSVIETLIEGNLVDYIAMDYKSSIRGYKSATGIDNLDTSHITASRDILLSASIPYEFRTTLVKGIHTTDDMRDIADELSGADRYYLQNYTDSDKIIAKCTGNAGYESFTHTELTEFLNIAKSKITNASIRGVEM